MLQAKTLCAVVLFGVLAGTAANADDRYRYGDSYRSGPQVRLGIDVVFGGYGYVPPRPPVVVYPAYYPRYAAYYPARGPVQYRGNKHRKHQRHGRYRDDCDD